MLSEQHKEAIRDAIDQIPEAREILKLHPAFLRVAIVAFWAKGEEDIPEDERVAQNIDECVGYIKSLLGQN